jgi:hypothetical protein
MFLGRKAYAVRPSLCVGIPTQINSLNQGHCEGRPSLGLGTRMLPQEKKPGNEASSYPGSFGKDPGIGWSRDSTKINCPRGSGKVSNYMLPQNTLNFKLYQEWDFTIYSSKRQLTSILYLCMLLNYKNTVAFYQQSSQETNKTYWYFEVGYSLETYIHIKLVSRQSLYIFTFICS